MRTLLLSPGSPESGRRTRALSRVRSRRRRRAGMLSDGRGRFLWRVVCRLRASGDERTSREKTKPREAANLDVTARAGGRTGRKPSLMDDGMVARTELRSAGMGARRASANGRQPRQPRRPPALRVFVVINLLDGRAGDQLERDGERDSVAPAEVRPILSCGTESCRLAMPTVGQLEWSGCRSVLCFVSGSAVVVIVAPQRAAR